MSYNFSVGIEALLTERYPQFVNLGILGAGGITLEYPVLRHASNLESVPTYEGTEEVHQLAVGKAVTDYSAFRLATTPEAPQICGNPAIAGRLQRPLCLSVVVMTGRAF